MAIEESTERSDANSRLLKQRARATVPTRDTRVIKTQPPEQLEEFNSTPPTEDSAPQSASEAPSREPQPEITTHKSKLATFTLRVDDKVDKGLKSLCTIENISKETFLEAAYLVCMENQEFMQQVLSIATERKQERREAGIQRRALAMTRYLH